MEASQEICPADSSSSLPPRAAEAEDSMYLSHGELKFVWENDKNQYFELGALGVEPFRLYKTKVHSFLKKLDTDTLPAAERILAASETRQLEDGVFSQVGLDEAVDPKTGLRFRVNLVGQVFNGKPSIYLRSDVFLKDEKVFHPTRRYVRLAICRQEFDAMKLFIDRKLKSVNKSLPMAKRTDYTLATADTDPSDPDNVSGSP